MYVCMLYLNVLMVVFGAASGIDASSDVNHDLQGLIKQIVNELVDQKVGVIKKQHEIVTNDLRQEIERLKQEDVKQKHENAKQNAVIENLRHVLDTLKQNDQDIPKLEGHATEQERFYYEDIIKHVSENQNGANVTGPPIPTALFHGRRASPGHIGFCAYLTNQNSHMMPGEAIKFDKILLNDGGGYNGYTGAFTAPLSGVYLFTFHFVTRKMTFVRLVVDGVNQVDAQANPHSGYQYPLAREAQSMGGNTAIVHVNHGQAVLVEIFEVRDAEVASSDTFRWSTFSGVLLY